MARYRRHRRKPLSHRIIATAIWELLPIIAFTMLLLL